MTPGFTSFLAVVGATSLGVLAIYLIGKVVETLVGRVDKKFYAAALERERVLRDETVALKAQNLRIFDDLCRILDEYAPVEASYGYRDKEFEERRRLGMMERYVTADELDQRHREVMKGFLKGKTP